MTRSTAWERVRQARRLAELPATSEAFAGGEVNLAHVGVITRSAEQVGCESLRDAEPILLEAARRLDARQLRYVTAQLRHCLDPNGSLKTPTATTSGAISTFRRCWTACSPSTACSTPREAPCCKARSTH